MSEPENRLLSVAEHWLPRIEVAGIPSATAKEVIARAGTWENWLATWSAEGEAHARMAADALAAGHCVTAGEAYARASLFLHFAQFMAFDDLAAKAAAAARKCELFRLAAPLLDPPAELVAIPFEGKALRGYLRRPTANGNFPLVLIIPGSDSTKEEFPAFERHFLARNLATFSLDGPGQGEGRELGSLRADIAPAINAALQVLKGKPGLTGDTALVGMAFGGFLALKASSRIAGLKAVVSINGFFDLGGLWDTFPQVYRDNMTFALGGGDPRAVAQAFTLRGDTPITMPALILHGGRDKIFPPSEAEACAELGKSAALQIFPTGNHVCNNIPWAYRPLVADWLADRIGTAPKTGR